MDGPITIPRDEVKRKVAGREQPFVIDRFALGER
jgi:hypothetical protein